MFWQASTARSVKKSNGIAASSMALVSSQRSGIEQRIESESYRKTT